MDCENKNLILQEKTYDSKEYQLELIRLLENSDLDKTRFWFGEYVDQTHISIRLQNQNICAKALVTVPQSVIKSTFMRGLMSVKGISYNGPLIGVEFDYKKDILNPEIILTKVDDIID